MEPVSMNKGMKDVDSQRCFTPQFHGAANEITNKLADTHLEHIHEKTNNIKGDMDLGSRRQYGYVEYIVEEFNPLLWKELAAEALEYYSKQNHGAELKLVGEVALPPLIFKRNICGFHLSFQAQDTKDSSVKDIFAQVFRSQDSGDTIVNFYDIMDPTSPNVMKGCEYCSSLHPKNFELYNFPHNAFPLSTR